MMTTIARFRAACGHRLTVASLLTAMTIVSVADVQAATGTASAWTRPGSDQAEPPLAQSVACAPRPRVIVRSEPSVLPEVIGLPGQDSLVVKVSVTGAGNSVHAVRFTTATNALVSVLDPDAHAAPFEVTFPADAQPVTLPFILWRPIASQPSFVGLVVVDGCGEWSTFVGRGIGG